MRLLRTTVTGFGPHRDLSVDWSAFGPLVAVVAPNGRGKTFLVDSMFAGLYGSFPGYGGSIYDALTQDGHGRGQITLDIEHRNTEYRITRQVAQTPKTKTQTATVESEGVLLAGPKITSFDAWITATFGPESLALATWCSPYGFRGDLCNIDPADRSRVVRSLIDSAEIVAVEDRAKKAGAAANTEAVVNTRVRQTMPTAVAIREALHDASTRRATAIKERTRIKAEVKSAEADAAYLSNYIEQRRPAYEIMLRNDAVRSRQAAYESAAPEPAGPEPAVFPRPAAPEKDPDLVQSIEDARRRYTELSAHMHDANAEYARLVKEYNDLGTFDPPFGLGCAPCALLKGRRTKAEIQEDQRRAAEEIARLRAAQEATRAEGVQLAAELAADDAHRKAEYDAAYILHTESLSAHAAWEARDRAARQHAAQTFQTERGEMNIRDLASYVEAGDRHKTIAAALDELRLAMTLAERNESDASRDLATHRDTGVRANELDVSIVEDRRKADGYSTLARAFGRTGIQALLVEMAVKPLETEASAMLRDVTDGRFDLRIQTVKANADGSDREQMSIIVADSRGERDVSRFSGGERRVIAPVLRLAASKWASDMGGYDFGTWVFDEVFDAVNAENADRIVDACERSVPIGGQVILVTPDPDYAVRIQDRVML